MNPVKLFFKPESKLELPSAAADINPFYQWGIDLIKSLPAPVFNHFSYARG
jgi:hypothetical protein